MIWWSLPGPTAFIAAITDDLREGKSVFLQLPAHVPSRLSNALKEALGDDFAWVSSTADAESAPIDFLYELLVPEIDASVLRNAQTLVRQQSFQGYVIWLDGITMVNWPCWSAFFLEYERASRALPPARRSHFLVPLIGSDDLVIPAAISISTQKWDGWPRPSDIRFYSYLQVGERRNQLETELSCALVAELSGWDPELCEWLAPLSLEQLTHPIERLTEFARKRKWDSHVGLTNHKRWCFGLCQTIGGKSVPHSSVLAPTDIDRLIWKAEIGVLMPYIEEQRQELLKKYEKSLWVPFKTKNNQLIENTFDLEVGHIEYQLASSGVKRDELNWVSVLKEARNSLSHLEPVETGALKSIIAGCGQRQYSRG